jgi:hypothetical protein
VTVTPAPSGVAMIALAGAAPACPAWAATFCPFSGGLVTYTDQALPVAFAARTRLIRVPGMLQPPPSAISPGGQVAVTGPVMLKGSLVVCAISWTVGATGAFPPVAVGGMVLLP